jgi:hypothetical protein
MLQFFLGHSVLLLILQQRYFWPTVTGRKIMNGKNTRHSHNQMKIWEIYFPKDVKNYP